MIQLGWINILQIHDEVWTKAYPTNWYKQGQLWLLIMILIPLLNIITASQHENTMKHSTRQQK